MNDLQFPQKKKKRKKRKVEWLTINICLFFPLLFILKKKKKERNLKRCDMDWWVKLLDFDKIWVRVRFTDWDPVQYLGYCTGCNSSNFSPWYNLTATLNWHFIDPCQKKISSSFFPLLSRYTKLKKKKKKKSLS